MKTLTLKLTGISQICFHNERLANPTCSYTIELGKLTKSRNKTEETLIDIQRIEWRGGFYDDGSDVAVVSADMVLATGLNGAKKRKQGPVFKAGVFTEKESFPLEYDGPKKISQLWGDERFLDYRGVVVSSRRIMRARPVFRQWAVTVELVYDDDVIQRSDLIEAYTQAGRLVGMGERRPRWGRFEVEVVAG